MEPAARVNGYTGQEKGFSGSRTRSYPVQDRYRRSDPEEIFGGGVVPPKE